MLLPGLDTITGCLLVGTWVSSLLYMFEIMQGLYYFRHFEQDDWRLKTLVTVALLVDTLSFVGDCICVYLYTITHAGDLEYLESIHWPLPLYGFTTGVLAVLCQAYLVVRYWRFAQKTLIALSLSFGIMISFGSVFTLGLMVTLYPSFADRSKFKIPSALWLVSEVAVNAGIATALLWEFRNARGILKETRSVLGRLTAVTIQSGAAGATIAGTALIVYYMKPESNVYVGVLYPLGRVYVITLVRFFLPISRSVWDVVDLLIAFKSQYPEPYIRRVFWSRDDRRRRARAVDIHALGHRRLMRYSCVVPYCFIPF
ncbi:hypothetical protein B0H19DRAFT_1186272 [Mycena capillaripes]|nr:hypothetical protein B0H19DRAFT_1186272 [Mycena capillaripes]